MLQYITLLVITLITTPVMVQAAAYSYNYNDVIGDNIIVTLTENTRWHKLAFSYEVSVSDLKSANPALKKKTILKKDTQILIPTQYILPAKHLRSGVVINMAEQRLYFFSEDENIIYTYPVAMGRDKWRTPTKSTRVKDKKMHPTWYVPNSIREHSIDTHGYLLPEFIPPGPKNPLGTRAIYLKMPGILIHGNNNYKSIGKLVSSGCIRMYNHNIEELFDKITPNTPVHIVHHPIKIGKINNQILLEVHKKIRLDNAPINDLNSTNIDDLLNNINNIYINLDYNLISATLKQQHGVPITISL